MQHPGSVLEVGGSCCSSAALRVNIFLWGGISLVVWGCCIGFTLGYCAYFGLTLYGSLLSIPVNVGYVYVTARIIFLISGSTHVTPKVLVDLQRLNARMVALLMVGFSVWVTGVVWFCIYYQDGNSYDLYNNAFLTFFVANFGFVLTAVLVGLSGGLHDQLKKEVPALRAAGLQIPESPPKYSASQGPSQVLSDRGLAMTPPAPWPSTSAAY